MNYINLDHFPFGKKHSGWPMMSFELIFVNVTICWKNKYILYIKVIRDNDDSIKNLEG